MPASVNTQVKIGIDGCKAGWFAFVKHQAKIEFLVLEQLTSLLTQQAVAATVLIDMPMGFPEAGEPYRQCDKLARQWLPGRAASVFPVPCKAAVYAEDFATACQINQQLIGKGFPIQTWNIVPKMRQLASLRQQLKKPSSPLLHFYESHPELLFAGLSGQPMQFSKATAEGRAERLAILTRLAQPDMPALEQALCQTPKKLAKADDIIDAFVLLYAATQQHRWQFLPALPDPDNDGIARQIVFVPK
ncbi:DUF429 domain-containing protein [Alishewanella longhuensis]|uniref:DUF429 domain-containing protein n=1 Tax=Alishewanella longhuensis TaxID=1091037 RepID=UPI00167946BC|nr:DUF429 domain-containing protein [Alishewanella longhuensis]